MNKIIFLILFILPFVSFGQCPNDHTQLIFENGSSIPTGWTVDDFRSSYWLLTDDAGSAPSGEVVITSPIDVTGYTNIVVNIDVATFGGGTAHPALIEYSTDGGTNYNAMNFTTATPSNSSYIAGGDFSFTVPANTSNLVIRLSKVGSGDRDVRVRNFYLCGENPTVVADRLEFTSVPASVLNGAAFSLEVCATNGSFTQTDYSTGITLTQTTGTSATVTPSSPATPSNGCVTFNITPNADGENIAFTATSGTLTSAMTGNIIVNEAPNLVINEIHSDPDGSILGDANGDGVRDGTDDEFVEFINNGSSALDLSGFEISDEVQVRHVFPSGSIVPAGGFITVFGGGSPTGISGIVQTASTGGLGLNNGGDDVVVTSGGTTIVSYTYGSEAGDNQSIARDPDITGGFTPHLAVTGNSVRFSPGELNEGALPVNYSFFKADNKSQHIHLTWQTHFEQNNDHFNIERSPDSKTWKTIGKVQGNGTTDEVKDYSFVDEKPLEGINYYRLKQVDYDGAYEYSSLVSVNMGKEEQINIYPNPVSSDEVTFEFEAKQQEGTRLLVYHINGQLVKEVILGNDAKKVVVNINDLVKGMYMVHLVKEQSQLVQRFVKH